MTMKSMSKKIIFFGTEDFSLIALQGLVEAGYSVAAVVTKPDSKRGRSQKYVQPSVKPYALDHSIPVWQPEKLSEIKDKISSMGDVAGVLVSYGKIIPQSIINLFNPGIINLHPSLLPLYRGPSPIESAIINGDNRTGVSIMQLAAGMDSGPVYAQMVHPLSGIETKPDLYKTLAHAGTAILVSILPDILDGSLQPLAQNDADATYCKLLSKVDAWLDIDGLTAEQAERRVRGQLGFPKTKLKINEFEIIITKAHVAPEQKTPLDIRFKDGVYLSIDELVAPSGRTMTAGAFINGYLADN